jgi:hypothetical protein
MFILIFNMNGNFIRLITQPFTLKCHDTVVTFVPFLRIFYILLTDYR